MMSQGIQQLKNVDEYGYPLPPTTRQKMRKTIIRSSKSVVGKAIYLLMSVIGGFLWLSRLGKTYSPLKSVQFQPRHILVIRIDLIGDLVLSMTVVHALKRTYPEAEIDLLATPASAKVVLHDPNLTEIITYDPNIWRSPRALLQAANWRALRAFIQRLHVRHYDLTVSVYGNWAATLAAMSGAKRIVGYRSESFPGFMTDPIRGGLPGRMRHWSPLHKQHEVDYCLALAQAAGATITEEDRLPRLYVDEQTRQEVTQLLRQQGIEEGQRVIICHINSNNGQSKRWPIPYWATLLDRLIREEGARVVLTGAPGDLPQIESVIKRMQEQPVNLAGKTSLTQLVALLQQADLLLSGDSGPIHMGVALDTPIVGIYGPTNPAISGPVSPRATVLKSDIWCSPCYNAKGPADCRFYTTQCMRDITPNQVFEAVQQKLKETAELSSGNLTMN